MESELKYPTTNYYNDNMHITVNSNNNMLMRG